MAFIKYASASVTQPYVTPKTWGKIRTASSDKNIPANIVDQANSILSGFNPEQYLLTHATIVASVDTYEPTNAKLGSVDDNGFTVNRKYGNYRIKPECDKFINNNLDSWDRDVLLKSYRTFIGSHNFVEHVQVEDLSKGRIIDAVARDIGDSVYIDILVATDRKHTDLVKAIESGQMNSMSMGCTVDFTQCTKCGNVAVDETEMCKHIRYEKGNTFFDEKGQQHRVAELCGHKTVDGGGVTFIEASWVATPAFTGAVMRNILSPTEEISKKAERVLSVPPAEWGEDHLAKVANSKHAFDFGGDDDDGDGGGDDSDPFQEFSDDIEKAVLNKIKRKIRQKINEDDESAKKNPTPSPEESTAEPNDNIIKQGKAQREYVRNIRTIVAHSTSSADLINSVANYNNLVGLSISKSIYRIALSLGSISNYPNSENYIKCGSKLKGNTFSQKEKNILIKLGTLLSLRKNF
jgi:hypothetical protein